MLHDSLLKEEKRIVCLLIDMETAGPMIGIVQISVVAFDHKTKKIIGFFDKYINPVTARCAFIARLATPMASLLA